MKRALHDVRVDRAAERVVAGLEEVDADDGRSLPGVDRRRLEQPSAVWRLRVRGHVVLRAGAVLVLEGDRVALVTKLVNADYPNPASIE